MTTFTVTWTIQVDAETGREAAQQALAIQRNRRGSAVVFQVREFDAQPSDLWEEHDLQW